uniref:Uncharacterized protein n=1 Tax=Haptolina ericina TaxID=156174 RepID=A0A7S3AI78_9EUKA
MAEKPKFELPGQTKSLDPNAADTDALTLFYESLHKQRPDSEMASRWLLQYGLLPHDEAAKLHKELGGKVTKTAAKGVSAKASSAKRKASDDDDFVAAKKPPPKKSAPKARMQPDSSEDEFESKPPPAKSKAAPKATTVKKSAAKPKKPPAADSSDEEDMPLSQRK